MAKDTDKRRGGFDVGETGGALSGLLAEEEELDRGALWRLGTWAAVSVGAVIVALMTNQSSIGVRREQSASADLLKQAQQLQLTNKESQNEARRLSSAIDTLNSDRDRLYSRVAVLEQGLDSVTGAIARQSPASPAPQAGASQPSTSQGNTSQANTSQANTNQAGLGSGNASQGTATLAIASAAASANSPPSVLTAQTASPNLAAPATTASIDPSTSVVKSTPVPVTAPVATTTPAVADKAATTAKPVATVATSEPGSSAKSMTEQQGSATQPPASLVASKSMMGPPDPAAGKLLEPSSLPKILPSASMPEVASVATKASDEAEAASSGATPELVVSRTEFGVDVGGANSIPGLRALWRGLLKSRSNAALAKLRPVIVIKESNSGLGMQLRLVAGPISDAAAAAKICASLTVSDRGCSTAVFEGQRLALGTDETDKADANKPESAKPETGDKPASGGSRLSSHRHYYSAKRPKVVEEPPPKPEPSTLSRLFGKRE